MWPRTCCLIAMAVSVLGPFVAFGAEEDPFARWEKVIGRFEEQDKASPPPGGGILFLGSSSIRMWDLEKWFPGIGAINRGFGGSTYADAVHFMDRIVLPYKPRVLVLYSGDNDVAAGRSEEKTFGSFKELVTRARKELPGLRVVIVPIKPSIARWKLWGEMNKANGMMAKYAEENDGVVYVDIVAPMLGEDGKPRVELFLKDGLHLSDAGYQIWTDLVAPHLKAGAE